MNPHPGEDGWTPSPELLAAYADGELGAAGPSGALRRHVEEWLGDHPEAAAEVEAVRRLREVWQSAAPADPGEAAWAGVFSRVVAVSPAPAGARRPRRWGRVALAAGLLATAAAAVWLAVLVLAPGGDRERQGPRTHEHQAPPGPALAEAFPVATAGEVEILSVQGDDTGTLVVGALPVQGPLVLLQPGEVSLTSVEPAAPDNMLPEIRLRGPTPPMIWAPLDAERGDPEESSQG